MRTIISTLLLLMVICAARLEAQVQLAGMPDADDRVNAIVRSGNTVFVGGEFTTFGGQPRSKLAAFDATTGAVLSWAPNPDDNVNALLVSGNRLFVGGRFDNIGGQPLTNLAAFNLGTLTLNTSYPVTNSEVNDLKVYNGKVYFPEYDAGWQSVIRRFDLVTGVVDPWITDFMDSFNSLSYDVLGNYIYVGGDFSSVGGNFAFDDLARFDITTGTVDAATIYTFGGSSIWVEKVLAHNGKIYVAGSFSTVNSLNRKGAFEINASGAVTSLDFHCSNSQNYALFPQGNTMWVGGNSASIGAGSSYRIAQVNLSTGYATCWTTMACSGSSFICAIYVQGDTVYAGGPDQTVSADPLKVFVGNPSYVSLGPDISIPSGGNAVLTANTTFQTYQWNTGATTPTITVSTPGTYWVNVTTPPNCSASDTIVVTLSTGLAQTNDQQQIVVYPNPASDFVYVDLPDSWNQFSYQLFDPIGRVMRKGTVIGQLLLDVQTLNNGQYQLLLLDEYSGCYLRETVTVSH